MIAKRLEIRYIWIDALCIIQSGAAAGDDWQQQSRHMKAIYSHSFLNISVAVGPTAEDGCFKTRDPETFKVCRVTEKEGAFVVVDDEWHRGISQSPLSCRGWVLQERLLSPRVLHFASDQVFWECLELRNASETFPKGLPPSLVPDKNYPFTIQSFEDPSRRWLQILTHYTSCLLTRPLEDKLVALSGVAEVVTHLRGDTYVAGFFHSDLPHALLWEKNEETRDVVIRWLGDYRAPSWTWASMDGPIWFPQRETDTRLIAEIIDFSVELVDENSPFGRVCSAELKLKLAFGDQR